MTAKDGESRIGRGGRGSLLIGLAIGMMVTCVPTGLLLALPDSNGGASAHIADTVAMTWGDAINADGSYYHGHSAGGGDFVYGMHIFVEPSRREGYAGPFEIKAVCYIGPPGDVAYMDDIGTIGSATDWEEANKHFGVVRFTSAGAYVGDGLPAPDGSEDDFLFPTSRMVNHR